MNMPNPDEIQVFCNERHPNESPADWIVDDHFRCDRLAEFTEWLLTNNRLEPEYRREAVVFMCELALVSLPDGQNGWPIAFLKDCPEWFDAFRIDWDTYETMLSVKSGACDVFLSWLVDNANADPQKATELSKCLHDNLN